MRKRRQIVGWALLSLLGCWEVFGALESGNGQAQTRKVPARPVQYQPPSTQEPPLAGVPQPPHPPLVTPPPPLLEMPPTNGAVCPLPVVDPPTPTVSLQVRVNACANPNEDIEYRLIVKNDSAAAAHHVLVRNPIPANARFVRATPDPSRKEPELRWNFGTLEPCDCRVIVLILAPTGTDDIKNCARVQFEHGQCVTTRLARSAPLPGGEPPLLPVPDRPPQIVPQPPEGKKGKEQPTKFRGISALSLEMVDRDDPIQVGGTTSYVIKVVNQGTAPVTNLSIKATIPPQLEVTRAQGASNMPAKLPPPGPEGVTLQFALLPQLAPGAKAEYEIFVKARVPGDVRFRVEMIADQLKMGGPVREEESTRILPAVSAEPPLIKEAKRK